MSAGTQPTAAVPSAGAVPQGSYVALGDSYTAGPDIPHQVGVTAGCEQSSSSYPRLLAKSLRLKLTDMSCSGAVIASLATPQSTGDGYVDTYSPSASHNACSTPASRWIEPLLPASPAAPLHPNAAGELGMADAIMHALTVR